MVAYKIARKVDGIMKNPYRKGPLLSSRGYSKTYSHSNREYDPFVIPVEVKKDLPATRGPRSNNAKSLS